MKQNKILIIGAVWVEPNSSAAGGRMLQLMQLFLEQGWQLTFATTAQKNKNAISLTNIGIDEVSITLNSTSFDDFIRTLNPSIVVFDRFMIEEQFGWRVAENCPNALRILDTEDLHCLRKTRYESIRKGLEFTTDDLLASDIAKREIASILRSDLSLIISAFEMELLKDTFKIDEKMLCYLPFLLKKIRKEESNTWSNFEDRNHFVFIGNFLHAPNIDAVLQLKKHIWSFIRKQLPDAELHIYGAYPSQQILELHQPKEGFLVKGFVENAQEIVLKAKVVLAPIRFGAGIKGKLTEAMQCGTPSVTTTIGAEGMHADLPWNGFISDDFEVFANKAVALYLNKQTWLDAQQKGIEIINTIYNAAEIGVAFIDEIEKLQENLFAHRRNNFLGNILQRETLKSTKYMSKWIEEKNKGL